MSSPSHLPTAAPPGTPPLEDRIATGLAKLGMALRHHSWQEAHAEGLTPTQGQILAVLDRRPGRSLSEVAEELGVRVATAGDAVATLVDKALVEKSRRPEDRRVLALHLTAPGRELAARSAQWPDLLAGAGRSLTDGERSVFLRALIAMLRELQESGRIPPAAMCATCTWFRPRVHDDPVRPHHCALLDAALADHDLRLDCPEHEAAPPDRAAEAWRRFRAAAT